MQKLRDSTNKLKVANKEAGFFLNVSKTKVMKITQAPWSGETKFNLFGSDSLKHVYSISMGIRSSRSDAIIEGRFGIMSAFEAFFA